jgi:PrtD family type I secretion system ABC transporter
VGNDWLDGGSGNDVLYGGEGQDRLYGEDGNDKAYGALGNDYLAGGNGLDMMWGDEGMDRLDRPAAPCPAPLADALALLRRHAAALGIFSLAITALLLVPTIYMLQVYDRVQSSRNETTLLMLTLLVLGLFVVLSALESVRSAVCVRLAAGVDRRLAPALFDALLAAPTPPGARPSLLAGDLATVRQFVAGPVPGLLFDAPLALVFVAAAFVVDVWLGVFVTASCALLVGLALWHERRTRDASAHAHWQSSQAGSALSEAVRHVELVRAMGMQVALGARWRERNENALAHQVHASAEAGRTGAVTRFVRLATQSLALGLGAWLVLEQRITPGMMIAASVLLGRALTPVEGLVANSRQILALREAWARLQQALSVPASPAAIELPPARGKLSAQGLTWRPAPDAPPLLQGVSFELLAGQSLGLIGPSGAGKSTLARLLAGALLPHGGQVRLDDAELAHWPVAQRAAAIGYLPQDVGLFDGAVAENIARMGEVDSQRVVLAAQRAGVHELVLRLPQG